MPAANKPIRILVLSVDIGAGHRRAAEALGVAVQALRPGSEVRVVEALDHLGPGAGKLARELYFGVLEEVPDIWGLVYGGRVAVDLMRPFSEFMDELRVSDLSRLAARYRPDLVLAMHPIACGLAAALGRTDGVDCPLVAVLTDLDAHPAWLARGLHLYLAPSAAVARELERQGLHGAEVAVTGIPLRPGFAQAGGARGAGTDAGLGLEPGRLTILLLGGGLGLGPLMEATEAVCALDGPVQVMLICGGNAELEREARALAGKTRAPLHVFGMVEQIWRHMAAADLAVSKPGGLTCSELLAAGVPLVALCPIPGQEEANCRQLMAQGAAVRADSTDEALAQVSALLRDPARLDRMRGAAARLGRPASARAAAREVLGLVDRWPEVELHQRQGQSEPDLLSDLGAVASDAVRTVEAGIAGVGKELENLIFGGGKKDK